MSIYIFHVGIKTVVHNITKYEQLKPKNKKKKKKSKKGKKKSP